MNYINEIIASKMKPGVEYILGVPPKKRKK